MKYLYHFCAEISDAATNRPTRIDGIITLKEQITSPELLGSLRDQLLDMAIEEGKAQDGDQVVIVSLSFLHEVEATSAR